MVHLIFPIMELSFQLLFISLYSSDGSFGDRVSHTLCFFMLTVTMKRSSIISLPFSCKYFEDEANQREDHTKSTKFSTHVYSKRCKRVEDNDESKMHILHSGDSLEYLMAFVHLLKLL